MTQLPDPSLSPPLLVATDGSPSAGVALLLVRAIAGLFEHQSVGQHSASLILLSVQPRVKERLKRSPKKATPTPAATATEPPTHQSEIATVPHSERKIPGLSLDQLTQWVHTHLPADFPVSLQVREGRAATEILNCARATNAGLIAVGHRGVGGVRELLLGSVSTAIARYAPCNVLVARSRAESVPPATLQHVLVVVDHSMADQQALAITRQLAPAGIQTVTLVYVQPPLNAAYLVAPMVSRTPSWQLNQSLQDAQREEGQQVLQRAVNGLDLPHVTCQTRLHQGDAGPSICQLAQELGANLIIVGSDPTRRSLLSPLQAVRLPRRKNQPPETNRPVLRNTRLSVTEDYVIHYAPCPVLLCRAMTATP